MVVKEASSPKTAAEPKVIPPSLKVTEEPVAGPMPAVATPAQFDTVAISVTGWPTPTGFCDEVSVMVVATGMEHRTIRPVTADGPTPLVKLPAPLM